MIVWCDTETTGLDRQQDLLLECAMVVTDDDLNEIAHAVKLVKWPEQWGRLEMLMSDFVRDMHTRSGLLDDMHGSDAVDVGTMDVFFENWLAMCGVTIDAKVPLAGASVDFDRAFLLRYLPRTHEQLSYRSINISSIKELANRWCPNIPDPPKAEAHRALPDIRESIELARYYRTNIFYHATHAASVEAIRRQTRPFAT